MALAIRERLVPFSLPATDGSTVSSEKLADRPVLAVVFWCNHCPYVKAWEDRMIALQREYAGRGVQFVMINSNDATKHPTDSFEAMAAIAKDKAYPFPYLHDATQEVARKFGAARTPEIFLFDQGRTLRYHGAPDDNFENSEAVSTRYLRDAIEAVLAGREPSTNATAPKGCTIKWKTPAP